MKTNFHDIINNLSIKHSNKDFLISEEGSFNVKYRELNVFCQKFYSFISSLNNNKTKKVFVCCENSIELSLIFISCLYSGLTFIPLNPFSSEDEINYVLKKTNPDIILASDTLKEKFKNLNCYFFNKKNFYKLVLETEKKEKIINKKNIAAEILFTSGSTGEPKGVVLSQSSLINNCSQIIKSIKIKKKSNFLAICPLYHNSGQAIPTLVALLTGGSSVPVNPFTSLSIFWDLVELHKINYLTAMPTLISTLLLQKRKYKNKYLKKIFCGGAKLNNYQKERFEKRYKTKVLNNYGLTETASILTTENSRNIKKNSVGKPLNGVKIKIFKPDNKGYGEVLVRTKSIFYEYLNNKNLTKNKFLNGWFRTGDVGKLDSQNYLFLKGRKDDMIIVSGENIYPSEIENSIRNIKGVADALVFSTKDKITQNKILLIYTGKKINQKILLKKMMKNISKFKIPKLISHISNFGMKDFIKSPSGKILKYKNLKIINKYLNAK